MTGAPATGRGVTPPLVLKLGGRALETPGAAAEFAGALAALGRPAVLVHGGGAEVTQWCLKLGLETRFADGLRVTDAATLEVAAAVLAGLANKRLVAALRERGVDAVGLAALDGGTLAVRPHARASSLGAVGEVAGADPSLLESLLAAGRTPVLASLGAYRGALLNVNADDAAAALAAALGACDLLLLSDAPGLELDGAVVRELPAAAIARALARPEVGGGMRPKLRAAAAALAAGVGRAHIACWNGPETLAALLGGTGAGTTLVATPEASHA
ncbi:MAG: acetylglutamate kinase [Candidatus Eisenbacteria bacterium]|nr:acetylglutamate kinase [Candidatus Eisenbacteria bacterium]